MILTPVSKINLGTVLQLCPENVTNLLKGQTQMMNRAEQDSGEIHLELTLTLGNKVLGVLAFSTFLIAKFS